MVSAPLFARYCSSCGIAYADDKTRACPQCSAPRMMFTTSTTTSTYKVVKEPRASRATLPIMNGVASRMVLVTPSPTSMRTTTRMEMQQMPASYTPTAPGESKITRYGERESLFFTTDYPIMLEGIVHTQEFGYSVRRINILVAEMIKSVCAITKTNTDAQAVTSQLLREQWQKFLDDAAKAVAQDNNIFPGYLKRGVELRFGRSRQDDINGVCHLVFQWKANPQTPPEYKQYSVEYLAISAFNPKMTSDEIMLELRTRMDNYNKVMKDAAIAYENRYRETKELGEKQNNVSVCCVLM